MKLHINGADRDAPDLANVEELAIWLQLPDRGAAVELNGNVIRRAAWAVTPLQEGDLLEVVRLVGGG